VLIELTQRIEGLEEERRLLEADLRGKRSLISRLRNDRNEARPPEYDDAMEIARYWKDILEPNARELNGPRLQNTIARLKHYSPEELKKSVWGHYCRPNVKDGERMRHDEGGARYVDLELIMRDAKHVEKGIRIAEEEIRYDQALLNDGAHRSLASLCDCEHARADHALFYLHGHDHCLRNGCRCEGFDDIQWQMREWELQNEHRAEGKRKRRPIPPPGQEKLM
jgi:hypothetical protein